MCTHRPGIKGISSRDGGLLCESAALKMIWNDNRTFKEPPGAALAAQHDANEHCLNTRRRRGGDAARSRARSCFAGRSVPPVRRAQQAGRRRGTHARTAASVATARPQTHAARAPTPKKRPGPGDNIHGVLSARAQGPRAWMTLLLQTSLHHHATASAASIKAPPPPAAAAAVAGAPSSSPSSSSPASSTSPPASSSSSAADAHAAASASSSCRCVLVKRGCVSERRSKRCVSQTATHKLPQKKTRKRERESSARAHTSTPRSSSSRISAARSRRRRASRAAARAAASSARRSSVATFFVVQGKVEGRAEWSRQQSAGVPRGANRCAPPPIPGHPSLSPPPQTK